MVRSVFPSEVYDLRLGSGFRPTPGGRDLGVGRVGVSGIGGGGRIIIAKVGLGERNLVIGQGGSNFVFPPALGVAPLFSRRFALFGRIPMVARHSG
jgi:hypothetical protein